MSNNFLFDNKFLFIYNLARQKPLFLDKMSKNQLNVDEVVAFFGGVAELVRQSALFLPDNPISQAAV